MYASIEDWINQEAVSFSLNATSFDKAADNVVASLDSSVELLGLGEALHGGEEILILRNRLFQRLAKIYGFSAIAIESGLPQASILNEYINGRDPATYEVVQDSGFSHGFGRLEANRELVEWLKSYNADSNNRVKLRIYGIDMPLLPGGGHACPAQVLPFVLDYLSSFDEMRGQEYRNRIMPLLGLPSDWEDALLWVNPETSSERIAAATALRIETENLTTELLIRRPELVEKGGQNGYLEALQTLFVARQLLNYIAVLAQTPNEQLVETLFGIRDAMIAENIIYVASRERSRGKVFVFAHNTHLQKGLLQVQLGPRTYSSWPAGSHLFQMLGPRYAVIGTALGESGANGIGGAEPGTLEAKLIAESEEGRFIRTHGGQDLPEPEIKRLKVRSGSVKNPTYMKPLDYQALTDFDVWALLNSVTYSRGGLPLPQ